MTPNPSNAELDAMLSAMAGAGADPAPDAEVAASADNDEETIARITASVLAQQSKHMPQPLARRRQYAPWWLGIATAAGLALVWSFMPRSYPVAPLPHYAIEFSGLDAGQRDQPEQGGARPEGVISIGNRLIVILRPEQAVDTVVSARLWHANGAAIERLDVPLQRSATGTIRLDIEVGRELQLTPGHHRLWLVVGSDEQAPDATELRAMQQAAASRERFVLPLSLDVRIATP